MIPTYLDVDPNSYRVEQKLTEGGLAVIYLARIVSPQVLVRTQGADICVVKMMKSTDPTMMKLFMQEVSIMNFLGSHKNIAKLIGYSTLQQALLMKYYPLGSLDEFINGRLQHTPYGINSTFNMLHGIASALAFMHGRQIAHCDVKPGNVLLEQTQLWPFLRPVLADFGVSCVLSPHAVAVAGFQSTNLNAVSIRYAAPEVLTTLSTAMTAHNRNADVIVKGDVYAFGAMVGEMLNRRKPWS
jgi:serine/threonine-protein kinase